MHKILKVFRPHGMDVVEVTDQDGNEVMWFDLRYEEDKYESIFGEIPREGEPIFFLMSPIKGDHPDG